MKKVKQKHFSKFSMWVQRMPRWLLLIIIVVPCVVIVFVYSSFNDIHNAQKVGKQFLTDIQQNNFMAAYNLLVKVQGMDSEPLFAKNIGPETRRLQGVPKTSNELKSTNGSVVIVYSVKNDTGTTYFKVLLYQYQIAGKEQWRVSAFETSTIQPTPSIDIND